MKPTQIEWTDRTWEATAGCSKVSAGCTHCYAERMMATRLRRIAADYGIIGRNNLWNGDVIECTSKLHDPQSWRAPSKVFVDSRSDLFHNKVRFSFLVDVFRTMLACPRHVFQLLTKRPERAADVLNDPVFYNELQSTAAVLFDRELTWPLPNVWLGTSVEDQAAADERIPHLLRCPAAVRFLSVEPMIGEVNIDQALYADCADCEAGGMHCPPGDPEGDEDCGRCDGSGVDPERPLFESGVFWVICGGESGPGARPMHPDWARSLRDQCQAASVPFWFKQWGEWAPQDMTIRYSPRRYPDIHVWPDGSASDRVGKKAAGNILDGRTWQEVPR